MSGSLIGGVVGAVIGSFFSQPALGFAIGSAIGGAYDYSQLPDSQGPRLQDRNIQVSSYGVQIPIAFGSVRLAGNVIWPKNFSVIEHSHSESTKGGGPEIVSFSYSATFALLLCEGPIEGIGRIWMNKKLMYDPNVVPTTNPAIGAMTFYLGTETQDANPLMVAADGSAPAYRGWAYIMFEDLELTQSGFGNRPPFIEVEINVSVTPPICPPKPRLGKMKVFSTGTVTSNYDSSFLLYIESSNEFWLLYWDVGPSYGIHRYDGTTQAFKGLISLPSTGIDPIPYWSVYDPFYNKVWGIGTRHIIRYDCATNLEDLRVYHGIDPWRMIADVLNYPLTVDRLTGTPWIGAGTQSIYKINPTTGAIAATWPVPTGEYECDSLITDNNGDCWFITYTNILRHVNSASPPTITDVYTGSGYRFRQITYDSRRHCIWICEPIDDPVTTSTGSTTWKFIRYNIALGVIDITISGQRGQYLSFEFDPIRDLLWVESFYGKDKLNAFCGANGALIHSKAENYFDASARTPSVVNLIGGITRNAFVFRKPGSNVYYIAGLLNLPTYPVVEYSWEQDDPPTAVTPIPNTLGAIVSSLCTRAPYGLSVDDIDVTQLTDIVDGYLVGQLMPRRSAIEPLTATYYFDAVESDHKIKFVKRGAAPAVTIIQDDRAAHEDGGDLPSHLNIVRGSELELPWTVDVKYTDKARDYQVGTQYARRITRNANDPRSIALAVVLSAEKAAQVALVNLYQPWLRTQFSFSTGMAYAKYEPTDVVTLPTDTVTYIARITSRADQGNGVIQWAAQLEDVSIYTQAGTVAASSFAPQTISDPGATILELLDIPILRDVDDNAGYYVAMGGTTAAWPGALLYRSTDSGITFNPSISSVNAATIGETLGALGTFTAGNIFDNGNTLSVRLISGGPLLSATETQVLNGSNTAIIGKSGLWEVVNFKNATLTATNTYTLSGFLRGRRGTEWLVGSHSSNDMFILVSTATWQRDNPGSAEIGLSRLFRAPPFGTLISNAEVVPFTNLAVGLEPYAPVDLAGTRDGVGNLTITWRRRSRIGYGTLNAIVPLGEATESYSTDIMNGATVLRTIASATPTVAYTDAMQITDWGTTQPAVTVNVYQISATVARGYALNGTI